MGERAAAWLVNLVISGVNQDSVDVRQHCSQPQMQTLAPATPAAPHVADLALRDALFPVFRSLYQQ
jgi:hypothetical protein